MERLYTQQQILLRCKLTKIKGSIGVEFSSPTDPFTENSIKYPKNQKQPESTTARLAAITSQPKLLRMSYNFITVYSVVYRSVSLLTCGK